MALKSDLAMVIVNINISSTLFTGISKLFIEESFAVDISRITNKSIPLEYNVQYSLADKERRSVNLSLT